MGKCPKCGTVLLTVNIADVGVVAPLGNQWNGVKYSCPSCGVVLSISIDPVALKSDIVQEVVAALRGH